VSEDDVERLYRMLREMERRLIHIEKELAENRGREDARSMTKAQVAVWAGIIIAGISAGTTILLRITEAM
jgi:hypothetical protein